MPDTGEFYLFEVDCKRPPKAGPNSLKVEWIHARCNRCRRGFMGSSPPDVVNLPTGGALLECPNCASRQVISGQMFADFIAKFPIGVTPPSLG